MKFVLFDGNAVVHRAYHAIPPLTTKSGETVHAVYGFAMILLNVIKELKPDCIAVAFDVKGPTFRHEKYTEYKATRAAHPEDLSPQFGIIKKVLDAFSIPYFEKAGFEADDVIGTIASQLTINQGVIPTKQESQQDPSPVRGFGMTATNGKTDVYIVTGDLDELQLVNKNTKVYTMRRGFTDTVIYDEKAVEERYGFTVDKFIDYKALRGDPSDNIPGVKGIGEKTASELIIKYGTLEDIYKNLDDLKVGVKKNLQLYKDDAFLSRELSTIVTDVDISFDSDKCAFGGFDRQKVADLFRELEFKSLLSRIPETSLFDVSESVKTETKKPNGDYRAICTKSEFETFLKELKKQKEIAFDTETTSLNTVDAELVGLCFSWKEGAGFYVPVGHKSQISNFQFPISNELSLNGHSGDERRPESKDSGNKDDSGQARMTLEKDLTNHEPFIRPKLVESEGGRTTSILVDGQIDIDYVLENLKPILEDLNVKKIGHNLKYDYSVLRKYDIKVSPLHFDTMIASYLTNPNLRALKLEDAAFAELGVQMVPITELIGTKKSEQVNFCFTDIDEATIYAAEDADVTYRLYKHLKPEIEKLGMDKLFTNIEMPLVSILADMELAGVKIDEKFLKKASVDLGKRVAELEKQIWKKAGEEFNIASPTQLKVILFDKLKLAEDPEIKRNLKKVKSGGYSTAATELEKIRSLHPIIDLVSEYRELSKLKSTYVDALPELINNKTGRVHTSFNQTITATGRLSSSDPNLQNIPIRTEVGREIRKAFIAEKGFKLIAADYSQIELRVIAHIADDKAMIEAFHGKTDIHTRTAAQVFGVSEAKVDSDMRRAAKVINFGVIYGISPHGLALATGMSREESKTFIDKYFEVHPQIKKYTETIVEQAKELGYVETIFGRRRYLPDLHSSNFIVRGAAERMAINMPIQGTAADLMKMAMIDISRQLAVGNDVIPTKEESRRDPSPVKGFGMTSRKLQTRMLLQVHDELVFEVPEKDVKKVAALVKEKMENVIQLKVPIEVKIEVGDNWGEMIEI